MRSSRIRRLSPSRCPCQGRREVPVVVFKRFAHARERRPEALFPERDAIEVDAVTPPVGHESLAAAHRIVSHVSPCVVVPMVGNRHAPTTTSAPAANSASCVCSDPVRRSTARCRAALHAHAAALISALAQPLFGLPPPRLGLALLAHLLELVGIVEKTGDAVLAHPRVLALALRHQARRNVPVVVCKHLPHARQRRCEALAPVRHAVEVNAVVPPVGQDAFGGGRRLVGAVPPRLIMLVGLRLQLHALAYNLGNFMRTLALPKAVEHWSLTTLREKLIKIGAKVVSHGRYVTFQLAEVAVPRELFRKILRLIDGLRPAPVPP